MFDGLVDALLSKSEIWIRVLRGYHFWNPHPPRKASNPPDPPRDLFKPARPAPQCFQTRPTRPVYPNTYPNPTRLPAESMMQMILVATAYDSISGPVSNEINFQLFFEDVFFELEIHIKYMKVQTDEMRNANNHKKKNL